MIFPAESGQLLPEQQVITVTHFDDKVIHINTPPAPSSYVQTQTEAQAETQTQPMLPQKQLSLTMPPPNPHHRYLLALGYQEQLSAATHNLFSLGALALDWEASLVEPFVKKSFLCGFQNVFPLKNSFKAPLGLFEVYVRRTVNNILHKISPQVTMFDFNAFITDAPEDITFFYYQSRRSKTVQKASEMQPKNSRVCLQECNHRELPRLKLLAHKIEEEMKSERLKQTGKHSNFKVNRIVCLYPNKVYRTDHLEQCLPNATTIIFNNWRGCGLQNCAFVEDKTYTMPSWRDSFRYGIQARKIFDPNLRYQHSLHNPNIEDYAKRYLNHLGYTDPFIAIHVRTERLVKNTKNDPMLFERCLKELVTVSRNLTRARNKTVKTLLLTDVGSQYGTGTCQVSQKCNTSHTRRIMDRLKQLGFQHQWYDPSILNSTENSGYVSLVEMHMLASAEKLVLVGFGGFQAITKHLYLSNGHSEDDAIHICHSR